MSKKPAYRIPFYGKTMMEYTSYEDPEVGKGVGWGAPDQWRENSVFAATLKLEGQYRGRSAARVRVTNTKNGEKYSLGLSAFYEAVCLFGADAGGQIHGTWTFRKQGANYGVYPVAP